ncbi:MAG: MBL fold metallo-hydrolase [Thiobacillus sp. SCN 64-35]|nr:MAG: MBL fold metallo-hydrolase [Thiobacillus sp. SCN 64-35]ODU86646.1 MAG: MBL fold metallo-hydrolase [Thiobacillus sp. SCN 65-179]OJW34260.1 MAG: MBL fold metallo-hydrolase [Thiobacillus sp. 65-69]
MLKRYAWILVAAAMGLLALSARADYQPRAEKVVDNVYAIVGPLGQRSADNDGLNANFGFVVTTHGVILIDSGASRLGAEKLAAAVARVTDKPVRWVVNTGSQDHRWLGNDYFAARGAEVIALARTAATQAEYASQHLEGMKRFLGERMTGTKPLPAPHTREAGVLELGGERLELAYTDAHFPGDARVWLPRQRVVFSGDLVYVDRLLGVLPWSSVQNGQRAFKALAALAPLHIVPGHGRVCDLAQAQRETGDYYDFLANRVGAAAKEMEPMDATLDRHADLPEFRHLQNYDDLHRANMNRAFVEFEAQ